MEAACCGLGCHHGPAVRHCELACGGTGSHSGPTAGGLTGFVAFSPSVTLSEVNLGCG